MRGERSEEMALGESLMRSRDVTAFGRPLAEALRAMPKPTGSEVLLCVGASGVCHSDLHVWEGEFDLGQGRTLDYRPLLTLPLTLGHEMAGEVAAVGPDAHDVRVGDRRVVYPWIGCGDCPCCAAGEEHLCAKPRTLGIRRPGGFATHVLVPHPRYLFDYGSLHEDFACTCACSGLTAYSALLKAGCAGAEDPLMIIGAGGVGLAAIGMARSVHGLAPWVAEIDAVKARAALDAGAAQVVDPRDEGVAAELLQAGGGMAAVVDCVGSEASVAFGLSLLRKGGRLVLVGLFGGSHALQLPLLPLRAISIVGSFVGSPAEFGELMALARAGGLREIPLQTRTLGEAQSAFDALKAGHVVGRVVLKP